MPELPEVETTVRGLARFLDGERIEAVSLARPDGELGYFSKRFDVYGREGANCRRNDGGTVRRIVQGGRSTWYCPRCQQ